MSLGVRHVAVAITAILHALSGIILSVVALSLQLLVPSLKQLPPSFDHISDLTDLPEQHPPLRRDSGYSINSVTSESVSSNGSLETPPSTLESEPRDTDNRATVLLASQARARAARPSTFAPSVSLWTLKEYPSPVPSQLGEERGTSILSDTPHDILYDSPSAASSQFSVPPQEEHSESSSAALKRSHSSHCLSLLSLHRKGSRSLSFPLPGLSRRKSSSSPHLREAAALSRKGSPSGDPNHRHASVSAHVRKIVDITPVRKCKSRKRKDQKNRPSESASLVGRGRTDPYQAPYFFPSPVSPWADEYARLVRLDRKLVLSGAGGVPASPSASVRSELDQQRLSSWPGERVRSV